MEPQQNQVTNLLAPLNKVTPLSKYLALVLFVALPFLGGWIGYMYAPEKVVEKEVIKEVVVEREIVNESAVVQSVVYQNSDLGIEFYYPSNWIVRVTEDGENISYAGKQIIVSSAGTSSEKEGSQIVLSIVEVPKLGTIYDSVEDILKGKNSSSKAWINDPVPITVAGAGGVMYTTGAEGSSFKMVMFENNSLVYSISTEESETDSIQEMEVFSNLVNTLKLKQ